MPRQNMEEQMEYWSNIINIREDECKKNIKLNQLYYKWKIKLMKNVVMNKLDLLN